MDIYCVPSAGEPVLNQLDLSDLCCLQCNRGTQGSKQRKCHDCRNMMPGEMYIGQGRLTLAGKIWEECPGSRNRCAKA